MATPIELELILKKLADLESVPATLKSSTRAAEALLKQFESIDSRIVSLANTANSVTTNLNRMVSAAKNLDIARLARQRQDIPATNNADINLQIKAQEVRYAQRLLDTERLYGAAKQTSLAAAEKELAALNKLKEARTVQPRIVQPIDETSLFKVQTQLLVNYTLMNQVFKLFSFGAGYVKDFDLALTQFQAITQTTNTEMASFSKTLIEVSQNSRFSAVEVAKAATVMGQAGFSAREISKSIGAVINLATASGSDLASSVDVVTSSLTVFNLNATEAGHVANVLTGALNLSKLDIQKLALGIQYAGNTAHEMGISLEELVSTLGALSNSGIKSGSTLGTGLRQLLVELQSPTKKMNTELQKFGLNLADVDVQARGIVPVLQTLRDAGFTGASAFKAFDIRAAATFITLSNNIDTITEMQTALNLSNAAAEAANKQMGSLSASIDRFSNNLGLLINQLSGPFKDGLVLALQTGSGLLILFQKLGPLIALVGTALGSLFVATVGVRLAALVAGVTGLSTAFKGLGFSILAARLGLQAFLATPIGAITASLTALLAGFQLFSYLAGSSARELDKLRAAVDESKGEFDETGKRIESVDSELRRLLDRYQSYKEDSNAVKQEVIQLQEKFGLFSKELGSGAITTVDQLIESLIKLRGEFSKLAAEQAAKNISDRAKEIQAGLQSSGDTLYGQTSRDRTRQLQLKYDLPFDPQNKSILNTANEADLNTRLGLAQLGKQFDAGTATDDERKQFLETLRQYKSNILEQQRTLNQQAVDLKKSTDKSVPLLGDVLSKNEEIQDALSQTAIIINEQYAKVLEVNDIKRKQIIAEFEASPLQASLEGDINKRNQQVTELTNALRDAKTNAEKNSIAEKLKKIAEDIDKQVKDYTTNQASSIFEQVKNAFPSFSLKDIGLALGNNAVKLSEISAKAKKGVDDATSSIIKPVKDTFDKIAEEFKLQIEQIKRAIQHAGDDAKNKITAIDAVVSEAQDTQRGGLRGKYSDAEIQNLLDQKKQLQNEALQAQIDRTEALLPKLNELVDHQKEIFDKAQAKHEANPDDSTAFRHAIETQRDYNSALEDQIKTNNDLVESKAKLAAATGQEIAQHLTLGQQIGYTLSKYIEQQQIQNDLGLNIHKNITQVLDDASTAFSTFVQESVTGTKTVGDAFRSMATSIIKSMLDIAARSVATQAVGGLASVLGSLAGGIFGGSNVYAGSAEGAAPIIGVTSTDLPPLHYLGGMIKGYAGGGDTGRDSQLALLRPGEYVLRQSAAQAIGKDTLDALNAAGNSRVSTSADNVAAANDNATNQNPNVVNVWVVSPDVKPPLSKSDVIATVSEDIYKGKQLKKLIKSVVSGQS